MRIVYMTRAAHHALDNFKNLLRAPSKRYPGPVFRLERCQGFDLNPGCPDSLLMLEFARQNE